MALACEQNVSPSNLALGAAAGLHAILSDPQQHNLPTNLRTDTLTPDAVPPLLDWLWAEHKGKFAPQLTKLTQDALPQLKEL